MNAKNRGTVSPNHESVNQQNLARQGGHVVMAERHPDFVKPDVTLPFAIDQTGDGKILVTIPDLREPGERKFIQWKFSPQGLENQTRLLLEKLGRPSVSQLRRLARIEVEMPDVDGEPFAFVVSLAEAAHVAGQFLASAREARRDLRERES